jgi:hypothetical protein
VLVVIDIESRYASMIQQIAELYRDDASEYAQLRSLRVTREEWDENGGGGHFWFDVSAPASDHDFVIEVTGEDSDGAKIEVILHSVGGLLNWAEWFRWPTQWVESQYILRWPPPSVCRTPELS